MKSLSYLSMGLGAGAALAVLYTHKSGEECRDSLKSGAQDGAECAKRKMNDGVDYVKQQANDLKNTAQESIDHATQAVTAPLRNLSAAADVGENAYNQALREFAPLKS